MKRAIDLAVQNVEEGGQPFGAVLVKDNQIFTEGVNELHKKFDVSGHAELLAIRKAQEQLQTEDLSGFTMYASGRPCEMCLTAMYFTGIRDIYYCASQKDMMDGGFVRSEIMTEKDLEKLSKSMKYVPLGGEEINPIKLWSKRHSL